MEDIYTNDKLERKVFVDKIINFIDEYGGNPNGLTFLLSGKFGSGKSTVLGYLKEELKDKKTVIEYNCWENNFIENPLLAILNSLNSLVSHGVNGKKAFEAIKIAFNTAVKLLTKSDISLFADKDKNVDIFTESIEYKKALNACRKILQDYCLNRQIVFLVDEMDRCLPDYQIKVLESLYHLFGIKNLVVIIAIDKEQLENSIQQYFGDKNVLGYLNKFVDYEIDLPAENDKWCFLSWLEDTDMSVKSSRKPIPEMIKSFDLALRDSKKIADSYNLVLNKINTNLIDYTDKLFLIFILMIKLKYPEVYIKYFKSLKSINEIKSKILPKSCFEVFAEDVKDTKIPELWKASNFNGRSKSLFEKLTEYFDDRNSTLLESSTHFWGVVEVIEKVSALM